MWCLPKCANSVPTLDLKPAFAVCAPLPSLDFKNLSSPTKSARAAHRPPFVPEGAKSSARYAAALTE
eukprot:7340025-Prymnesium_polylepis.1